MHPPVPVAEFAHYVNEMKANENYEFQKEYDVSNGNTWKIAYRRSVAYIYALNRDGAQQLFPARVSSPF